MISLGARYVDYGLTGGFFLFVALAVFGWHHPEAVSAILDKLPELQKKLPVSETVLASFFVVCVFATGLLLDLVGSLAFVWELGIFRKYLNRNKEWIGQIVAKYEEFLGEDINLISTTNFWDLRIRRQPVMLVAPFNRIESILISHLVLTADPTRLELVMDQMRTYRIARAVSSGLFVLSVAFYFIPLIEGRDTAWSVLAIYIVGFSLSIFMVRRAYSKLCSSLFSLLFVLQKTRTM
jgi:hypothetical protein